METNCARALLEIESPSGCELTLNNPTNHNAMSTALIDELCSALEEMLLSKGSGW